MGVLDIALDEIVKILTHGETGQIVVGGDRLRTTQPLGREVARPDLAHLALLHELVERTHVVLLGHAGVIAVGVVEVEVIGLQSAQRVLYRGADVRRL